jgi:hypothetical protein
MNLGITGNTLQETVLIKISRQVILIILAEENHEKPQFYMEAVLNYV